MGRALYRTHRSTSFDDVIGQDHITQTLKNAIQKQAISHAYLFTGPRGTGKTSVARILAHEINDLPYTDQTHLDIIEIDAASNRRIDEIRDLRDKVHIAPASARYKVYIIDEVHMLTREAFNALLKTLEEPPEHAVFILATTELHKVPDTIISRAQRYTFKPISHDNAIAHLRTIADTEKLTVSDDALSALATHGNGSFRDSISMLDQLSGLQRDRYTLEDVQLLLGIPDETLIATTLSAVQANDTRALFAAVAGLKQQGVDAARAAQALSSQLREGLIHKVTSLVDSDRAIPLLKELLPLTNGADGYIALELAALSVMQPGEKVPPREQSSEQPQKSVPRPEKPARSARSGSNASAPSLNDAQIDGESESDSQTPDALHTPVGTPKTPEPSDTKAEEALAKKEEEASAKTSSNETATPTPTQKNTPEKTNTQTNNENEPDSQEQPADVVVEASSTPLSSDPSEQWKRLLSDVKSEHNTLYGVLRMATLRMDDSMPVLSFSFGFHKKRVESGAHKQVVTSYIQKYFGSDDYAIEVSKQEKPKPLEGQLKAKETGPKSDVNPAIASVSNIFGSVELLE